MYVAEFPSPAISFADQSFSPLSALSATNSPSADAANTRLPALVTVPPPFIIGSRHGAVCVTGPRATSDPIRTGGAGASPGFGAGGVRNTLPVLYTPISYLSVPE